jgi:hypothetical protein
MDQANRYDPEVEELMAALRKAAAKAEQTTALWECEVEALKKEVARLKQWGFDWASECARHRERLRVVSDTLTPIVEDWLDTYAHFEDAALAPEARARRKDARELLTLLAEYAD